MNISITQIWKSTERKRSVLQTAEKASHSFLRKQKIKLKTFSAGACTWQKILLRLQVWNLSAISRQMMRAADCKELAESPEGDFRQAQTPVPNGTGVFLSWLLQSCVQSALAGRAAFSPPLTVKMSVFRRLKVKLSYHGYSMILIPYSNLCPGSDY